MAKPIAGLLEEAEVSRASGEHASGLRAATRPHSDYGRAVARCRRISRGAPATIHATIPGLLRLDHRKLTEITTWRRVCRAERREPPGPASARKRYYAMIRG